MSKQFSLVPLTFTDNISSGESSCGPALVTLQGGSLYSSYMMLQHIAFARWRYSFLTVALLVGLSAAQAQPAARLSNARSEWVAVNAQGKLAYKTLEKGDRIMDFSYAGYMGGGVAIPSPAVTITLEAINGDNAAAVQQAIDQVARSFGNQQPPGAVNWVIGGQGEQKQRAMPGQAAPLLPEGIYDSYGTPVTPGSLYLTQLAERLGKQAVVNIGYTNN